MSEVKGDQIINKNRMDIPKISESAMQIAGLMIGSGLTENEVAILSLSLAIAKSVGGVEEFTTGYYPKEKAWFDRLTDSVDFHNMVFKLIEAGKEELNNG